MCTGTVHQSGQMCVCRYCPSVWRGVCAGTVHQSGGVCTGTVDRSRQVCVHILYISLDKYVYMCLYPYGKQDITYCNIFCTKR